jgi:Ca2+-binding RTX toxin-like protein
MSTAGTMAISSVETVIGTNAAERLDMSNAFSIAVSSIDTVVGSSGTDVVTMIAGGSLRISQVETLIGSDDADTVVILGATNTIIVLGGGADTVQAGTGVDFFRFTEVSDSALDAVDVITGFRAGVGGDKLQFQTSLVAGGSLSLVTTDFTGLGSASAKFDSSTKTLSVDLDGNGSADMAVVLTGVSSLNSANIGLF